MAIKNTVLKRCFTKKQYCTLCNTNIYAMASTTPTKKGIVDFLWEWANSHNDWGKYLVDIIVKTERKLSDEDREQVFEYFLDSLRGPTTKKFLPLTITKPQHIPTNKKVVLSCLKNVTGVNKLAKNQIINFSKNITIIYGGNATGKTGYGRILKSLGFSYDNNNIILSNIFATREPKCATIEFKLNDVEDTFTWDGSNFNPILSNISVFNNNCVQISLNDRRLLVKPIGFELFSLISSELALLMNLLKAKISSYPTNIPWAITLTESTPQNDFIKTLSASSTEQRLTELSLFTAEDEKMLNDKEIALSLLNKELLKTSTTRLKIQISEIIAISEHVMFAQKNLTKNDWLLLADYKKRIKDLEGKTQQGIKEIADANGILFYETKEFNSFILAAEHYIRILDKQNYPETNDLCVYCNQPLLSSGKELLRSYQKLLNDTTQNDLHKLIADKQTLIDKIKKVNVEIFFLHSHLGVDEKQQAIQPKEIEHYNLELAKLKELFIKEDICDNAQQEFNYDTVLSFLSSLKLQFEKELTEKTENLRDIEFAENNLRKQIAELKHRKILNINCDEIKKVIKNLKAVEILNSKSTEFSTNSISRKTTAASEELLTQDFDSIFQSELLALRKSHIKIDLSFGTDKGNSKVSQKIQSYNLIDILSEGEQKAIALAEFLTELQLDNIKAPVIFDDPVNSLDHYIIDEVAKRLIELSKTRQVIVFTHSVLLLNSLAQQKELDPIKKSVQFTFFSVKSNFDETGLIGDVEEINTISYYVTKLETVLNTKPNGQSEDKLTREGYGHLRSVIELIVEEDILQRVVKRYKKGIAFPSLLRIDGNKLDSIKLSLNNLYERCCVSIDGHSGPEEIDNIPSIVVLRADYDQLKTIRKLFLVGK